ncbi:MAG: hypothetical protein LBR78_01735 [Holosporales bacterium]|jgi:hypothetical protein|nr:hypothetical protein [Holosporales bacterium]
MAVVTFYSDSSSVPWPSYQTADGSSNSLTRIAMYTYDSRPDAPYSGYNALLQLPIATVLQTVIDDPGNGYILGMPRGMRWRAIVGEYVAP